MATVLPPTGSGCPVRQTMPTLLCHAGSPYVGKACGEQAALFRVPVNCRSAQEVGTGMCSAGWPSVMTSRRKGRVGYSPGLYCFATVFANNW